MKILVLAPANMTHAARFMTAFAERGHEVHFLSMQADSVRDVTFERFKIPRFGVRYPHRWRQRWERYMARFFERFDVVNMHFLQDWGLTERVLERGVLVVKAYGSDVDHPPDTPAPDPKLVAARRFAMQRADGVVTSSYCFRHTAGAFAGLDPDAISAIPVGVDTCQFSPRRVVRRDATPVVGYYKGFEPVYGPLTMVEAVPLVLRWFPNVRFELVGDGSMLEACRGRAESLGASKAIRWTGRLSHEQIPELLAKWDVVAISSRKESFCVVALEASAMELPVVAPRVGGLLETVAHQKTGLLVDPDNAYTLAEGIVRLLKDPELRREMGLYGRRRVQEHYEWQDSVDRWLQVLGDAAAKKRSRGSYRGSRPAKRLLTVRRVRMARV